jgi:hypothetical protein
MPSIRTVFLIPLSIRFASRLIAASAIACLPLLVASGCSSVDRPNFSGSWKLDPAQSNFGPVPGPSESTQVIEHNEPLLRLTAESEGFMGANSVEFEFVTDGSEKPQSVDGRSRETQTYWDESVLVTEWVIDNPGQPQFEMVDRRSLSADGQTMTVDRHVRSNWAEWEQKAVYVRVPRPQDAPAPGGG